MNCRVCNQPTIILRHYENMPARAQKLHDTPIEDVIDFNLRQCVGCGLVQLDCEPVEYWREDIRTANAEMQERIDGVTRGMDFAILNHLEHVPSPNEYLRAFTGRGVVEVPNFDMIAEKRLFHEIMRDHLMYFTEDTLRFTLQYNGFTVANIGGVWDDYILSAEVEKRKTLDISGFDDALETFTVQIFDFVQSYKSVAIYGASHECFAILAQCGHHLTDIGIVDDSPLKQGKYAPVGGQPILPPSALKDADAVIVMGAGYSDIILSKLNFKGALAVVRGDRLEVIRE